MWAWASLSFQLMLIAGVARSESQSHTHAHKMRGEADFSMNHILHIHLKTLKLIKLQNLCSILFKKGAKRCLSSSSSYK